MLPVGDFYATGEATYASTCLIMHPEKPRIASAELPTVK